MTPDTRWFTVFARLKPGVSLEQAQAEMDVLGGRLAHDEPQLNRDWAVAAAGLRQTYGINSKEHIRDQARQAERPPIR